MALTPQSRATQAAVRVAAEASPDAKVTQTAVRAVTQIPAEFSRVTQAGVRTISEFDVESRVTQSLVRAVVRGRTEDPRIRAWTFTLDGHDFYVLRLGNDGTLVYDVATEQWQIWGSTETQLWRAYNGTNWIEADNQAAVFGSNVVVGDDGNGSLYFLNPDEDTDDDAVEGSEIQRPFKRIVQGQITTKGYSSKRVYDVILEGSIGGATNQDLVTVNLSFSDDRGNTYTDAGDITLGGTDYSARAHWRSLGSMNMPGRLFKVTDRGALRRIDFLDSNSEE